MLPKLPAQGLFPAEKAPSHLMWYLHVVSRGGGGGGGGGGEDTCRSSLGTEMYSMTE